MVYIAPAAAPANTLVGDVVVHEEEHLLQFGLVGSFGSVVPCECNLLHKIEILKHFKTRAGQYVLVPRLDDALVSLGVAYIPDRCTGDVAVLAADVVLGKLRAKLVHVLRIQLAWCIDEFTESLFDNLYLLAVLLCEFGQRNIGLSIVVLQYHKPMGLCLLVDKRNLHIGSLLTRVYLDGSDEMVEVELTLNIGSIDTYLVHAHFGSTLHVALVANPYTAPTTEVDVDRERGALLAVLQEVETDLFVLLRLFVVHPHDESRQIVVDTALVERLKLQVFLYRQ